MRKLGWLIVALLSVTSIACAQANLPVSADAWAVGNGFDNVNQNGNGGLIADNSTRVSNVYIAFDTTHLIHPNGGLDQVNTATLNLHLNPPTYGFSNHGSVNVYLADAQWSESLITLSSAPSFSRSVAQNIVVPSNADSLSIDVTSAVKAWQNGTPNFGLVITATKGSQAVFGCREDGQGAAIHVEYGARSSSHQNDHVAPTAVAAGHIAPGTPKAAERQQGGRANGSSPTATQQPARFGPPHLGPKVTVAQQNNPFSAVLSQLERQKSVASREADGLMKLSIRPTNGASVNTGTSAGAANTGSSRVNPGVAPSNRNVTQSQSAATPPVAGPSHIQGYSTTQSLNPSQATDLQAHPGICQASDSSVKIGTVSGESGPATFTQDQRFNSYTIYGCNFGDPGPTAKVYLYKQNTFQQQFDIEFWNNNWIEVSLPKALSGIPDTDDLTLVVQRADGKETRKSGFRFYAARDTVLLRQIPRREFSYNTFRPEDTSKWKLVYNSPSPNPALPPVAPFVGWTANVYWELIFQNVARNPVSGDDSFSFIHLQPGFFIDSYQLQWSNVVCDDNYYLLTAGAFDLKTTTDNRLQVSWQGQQCKGKPTNCPLGGCADNFDYNPVSQYAVNVWVTGPRGVDPWGTGLVTVTEKNH